MGDLQVTSPRVNGVVFAEDRLCSSPPSPPLPFSNPDPSSVAADAWSRAEKTTNEILYRIQPTLGADRRRREVVDYVQRLIRYGSGCEVYPYGSVPLKTYLPDGDIDLTALSCQNIEDGLVSDVHAVLRGEEINEVPEYEVKDVRFIDAEVKLLKCIVQNIVVDISFNQLGGLSTLCFLEKVDRVVGKNHLFKRSIILIKAWCYYESRILGAHHGLISTYALETLVLYIFNRFHLSLDGPLAVLYRFLDYFSKFDWDNFCVSLKGPVGKSSVPDLVVEVLENGGNTLLTEEFLRNCVESFSVPSRGLDSNLRAFPLKHLNIIDPLKENNNLGRSVNKGNFYRIRSAFKYGARKLGWILMLPEDRIEDELCRFFANTLDRHGSIQWDDMQTPSLVRGGRGFDFSSSLDPQVSSAGKSFSCLSIGSSEVTIPGNQHNSEVRDEGERYLVKDATSGDVNIDVSQKLEDSKIFAASGVSGMASTNGSSSLYYSNVRNHRDVSVAEKYPMHSTLGLLRENGKVESGFSFGQTALNSVIDYEKENHVMVSNSIRSHIDENKMTSYGSSVSKNAVNVFENIFPHSDRYTNVSGGIEASRSLLDLTGDYDSNIRNLQYGLMCNGLAVSPLIAPSPPRSPKLRNRNHWETVRQCLQIDHSIHSHTNSNGVVGQQLYLVNPPILPMAPFGSEEKRKPRGTGAYFPNLTSRPYRDRPVQGRGRGHVLGIHGQPQRHARNNGLTPVPQESNISMEGSYELGLEGFPIHGQSQRQARNNGLAPALLESNMSTEGSYEFGLEGSPIHGQLQRHPCNNGFAPAPQESNISTDGSYELGLEEFPVLGSAKARSSEAYFFQPSTWGSQYANGFAHSSDKHESGDMSPQIRGSPRTEVSSYQDSGIPSRVRALPSSGLEPDQRINSLSGADHKRIEAQAYHLKNEDDFPPLSL